MIRCLCLDVPLTKPSEIFKVLSAWRSEINFTKVYRRESIDFEYIFKLAI